VDIVAEAAKLREAMARGAQAAQQARAPGNGDDDGQSGMGAATLADAVGEASRGGADNAARPVVEAEVGRTGADSAARPVAEEGSGGGGRSAPLARRRRRPSSPGPWGLGSRESRRSRRRGRR